jgi:hypothetical protein
MARNPAHITTKSFEVIANVVREHEGDVLYYRRGDTTLAERFANELERHNPLFNRELFIASCHSSRVLVESSRPADTNGVGTNHHKAEDPMIATPNYPALTHGMTVRITPRLSPGESRDTEAGAQPWQATVVGWTDDKVLIADDSKYGGEDGFRSIDRSAVQVPR